MKGKYYLEEIDEILYSSNSYEVYCWYNKIFNNYDPVLKWYIDKPFPQHIPIEKPYEYVSEADHKTFLKALKQEKKIYEYGFVPERVKVGSKYNKNLIKTVWVKDPDKAKLIFESLEEKHEELF